MTADAQRFITPLPFKTLSRNPVVTGLYDEEEGWKPAHIRLADEADLLVVAPATANLIAKLAHGIADDALSAVDAETGKELYSSNKLMPSFTHFGEPVVVGGQVYVCTWDGKIYAFGVKK